MREATAAEGMKLAPVVAVAAWTTNDWLIITSIAYVALQAAYLVWKWRKEAKS